MVAQAARCRDRPLRVASRRLVDVLRSDSARVAREGLVAAREPTVPGQPAGRDDSVALLLLCAHPVLTPSAAVTLALRSVAGLRTDQIAAVLLVPPATVAQRISRAKATLRDAGARFPPPTAAELPARVNAARQVVYLMFTEGYTSSSGDALLDGVLTAEATRLGRAVHARLPSHDEAAGLLALMLLTGARRPARTDLRGELVPLAEQEREQWDRALIAEGVGILERVLVRGPAGSFALQAAIAAVHADARTWAETDWPQIVVLYRMLAALAPGPAVQVNLAVAVAMTDGPDAPPRRPSPTRAPPS